MPIPGETPKILKTIFDPCVGEYSPEPYTSRHEERQNRHGKSQHGTRQLTRYVVNDPFSGLVVGSLALTIPPVGEQPVVAPATGHLR